MASVTSFLALLEPLTEKVPPAPDNGRAGLSSPPLSGVGGPSQEQLLADARVEAERIVARAKAEAAELLEDAQLQAEAFREAAWQEGHHAGQQAAKEEARAAQAAQREALREEVQALVTDIGEARQALWERQEGEMVAFVLDIARQVIKTEVTQNPEVVQSVVRNAVRRVTDKSQVRIRVAVADAGRVREMRDDLMAVLDGIQNLEIVDDRRVGPGGCVIETQAGTIDAKIETQLAEVARALKVADDA